MQFDLSYVSLHSVSSVAQQKYVSVPMPAVSRPQSPGSLDLSILFRAPVMVGGKIANPYLPSRRISAACHHHEHVGLLQKRPN